MDILLEAGAEVNITDHDGNNAIQYVLQFWLNPRYVDNVKNYHRCIKRLPSMYQETLTGWNTHQHVFYPNPQGCWKADGKVCWGKRPDDTSKLQENWC